MLRVNASFRSNSSNSFTEDDIDLRLSHSQFNDQKLVEKFCSETHLLKIIDGAAAAFLDKYKRTHQPDDALAPIIVRLDFVYAVLVSLSNKLLQLAIDEPLQFAEAVKYCVYSLVRARVKAASQETRLQTIDIAQLHVQWRILGLPLQRNLLFDPFVPRLGLALVQGILSAYTTPETLVLQSIWYCGSGCVRNAIQTTSTDAPSCSSCSRPMSEYQKLRVTENYKLIALLPSACIQTPKAVDRVFRPVLIRSRDYTYDCELKLGSAYLVTGYFCATSAIHKFESCHIRKM